MSLVVEFELPQQGKNLIKVVENSMRGLVGDGWKFKKKKNNIELVTQIFQHTGEETERVLGDEQEKQIFYDQAIIDQQLRAVVDGQLNPENIRFLRACYDRIVKSKQKNKYCGLSLVLPTEKLNSKTFGLMDLIDDSIALPMDFIFRHSVKKRPIKSDDFPRYNRIFTLIDPDQLYLKLLFYANAGYNFDNPARGGRVLIRNSPQYKTIERLFNQIEVEILRKLHGQIPYR